MRRFCSWILVTNALFASALAVAGEDPVRDDDTLAVAGDDPAWDDETVALSVRFVHRNGAKFEGLVVNTHANQQLFPAQAPPDLAAQPANAKITLERFNGLSGSITLALADCRALEVVAALHGDELSDRDRQMQMGREQRWDRERDRLARIAETRDSRAGDAAAAAAAIEEAGEKLPPALQGWIDRFAPADGWVPAKKAQLYYQQYILDTHKPTDRERDWLDHYDDWKVAYDAWLKLEQDKAAAAAANAATSAPTAGTSPSSAATGHAAGSDPDAPTAEEQKNLLPPLDENAPKPTSVPEDAPKPTPTGGGR